MRTQLSGALAGRVALVTGAASGIGFACVEALWEQGAAVAGLDVDPKVASRLAGERQWGRVCDIRDSAAVSRAVEEVLVRFGALDVLVSNAGVFPKRRELADMDEETWSASLDINLSSAQRVLTLCIPHLKLSDGASVVFIGSRNVHAPGRGAAAYSVAKAGLTQLARVAALELSDFGIRVNVVHPDAVFDTALWTPAKLEDAASVYGLSVEDYKKKNLLRTEIRSRDVAALVCALAGPAFSKTTGAQIPIDGGSDRVV